MVSEPGNAQSSNLKHVELVARQHWRRTPVGMSDTYVYLTSMSEGGVPAALHAHVRADEYCGSLAIASPPLNVGNHKSGGGGGGGGGGVGEEEGATASAVPLFGSTPLPLPRASAGAHLRVVDDVAGFAGGAVWSLDWRPPPTSDATNASSSDSAAGSGGASSAMYVAVVGRCRLTL